MILVGALVAILAGAVPGSMASDTYIFAKVLGRVPGKNLANVEISWAYKCLGDKLGDATYEWTLKAVRQQPKPEQTTELGQGTSKVGKLQTRLGPGQYLLPPTPTTARRIGARATTSRRSAQTFVVPDYCAWNVTASKGAVQLERPTSVRLAKPGDTVAPGDALVTPRSGSVRLVSKGGEGVVAEEGGSRVTVDPVRCARAGGWRLEVARGSATVEVKKGAPRGPYVVATPNATSAGLGAKWVVSVAAAAKPRTKVKALAGSVTVAGKAASEAVVVRAGQSTVVAGSSAPSKPRRG